MGITRPTGEQLRFRSQFTGDHVLDTYLEASEKGNRQLSDLLDDLFDSNGTFRSANFEFRFDESTDKIQFRAGNFASSTAGWTDITTFFKLTGTFNSSTTYNNFDLITLSTKDIYIVHGLSSGTTFADEAAVIASSNTDKLVDVSEARDWAKKTDGIVDSTDYSAKAWAIGGTGVTNSSTGGAAKEWATKTSGTVDGTNYSAKYWATHTDVVNVSTNIASVNSVASAISNVNTVSTNISNVNTTASSIANVNTVAAELGSGQDVTVVAANITNVGTVASDIANVNTTAGSIANVNTVAGSITNVNNVGGSIANVNTTATNIADVNTVATEINNNNLQTVAADIQAVIDVADDLNEATSEIDVVANNIASVNTVGTNIANVNTVAGISSDVTTAATNSVQFNNTYLGAQSSAPTADPDGSALDLGDLYFDTTSSTMKVYSASGWINAGSSVNGTADRFSYTATANQTTFTGNDANSNSLAYDAGYLDVYMNGVKLVNGSDFTATNGTSIVLASGAALNDTIEVIAYGTFTLADHYTKTQADARFVNVTGDTMTGDLTIGGNATVGTNTAGILNVKGGNSTSPQVRFFDGGTGRARIGVPTGQTYLSLSGSDTLTPDVVVNSSGNVGIGTSSPSDTLHVKSSAPIIRLEDSDNSAYVWQVGQNTDVFFINTETASDGSQFAMTSAGNVGIGTSSPTSYANSQATLVIEDTSSPAIAWSDTGQARDWFAVAQGSGLYFNYADGGGSSSATNITSVLVLDNGGNVGIGTSSPSNKLDIKGTVGFEATNSTNSWLAYTYTDNTFRINYNGAGADEVVIDSSGNVGIGLTPEAHYTGYTTLDLGVSAGLYGNKTTSDTNSTLLTNNAYLNSGATNWLYKNTDEATRYDQSSGTHKWYYAASGTADAAISWSEAMRIDSSGRVGIGQSSMSSVLHVRPSSDTNSQITLEHPSGGNSYGGFVRSLSGTNQGLAFGGYFNGTSTERMRIDSSGQVGIATSSPSSLHSAANDLVVGNGSGTRGITIYSNTSDSGNIFFADGTSGNAAFRGYVQYQHNTDKLVFGTTGDDRVFIDGSGNVGIGTSSPSSPLQIQSSNNQIRLVDSQNTSMYCVIETISDAGLSFNADVAGAAASSRIQFNVDNSEKMRIDNDGNVGIGVTSPAQLLHVQAGSTGNGTIRVGGGAGLEISHDNSANTVQRIDSLYRTTSADANLQLRTGTLTFHTGTSSTERMRIDSAGRVTMPYQPTFTAWINTRTDWATAGQRRLPFDNTLVNQGSHFNTSTNRFTAPIGGRYQFNLSLNVRGDIIVYLYKNGAVYHGGEYRSNPSNTWEHCVIQTIMTLSANDYVEAQVRLTGTGNAWNGASSTWDHFSGHLIN